MNAMVIAGGFVLDSDWYWRIFEGEATLGDTPGATAAHDFLLPLSRIAQDRIAIDAIAVDSDGEGVTFRIGDFPFAIRCSNLSVDRFVEVINRSLAEAKADVAFAIVESRRYELRGVLVARGELRGRRFARGTTPPVR